MKNTALFGVIVGISIGVFTFSIVSTGQALDTTIAEAKTSKTSNALNVNPFLGTGGHGYTFPGATTPYGMVQLRPDTRALGGFDWTTHRFIHVRRCGRYAGHAK